MKKAGSCAEDCPIIGILKARDNAYKGVNYRDALMAERISQVPYGCEVLTSECELGGPHKQFLGGIACSSDIAEHPARHTSVVAEEALRYNDRNLDQAAIQMYAGGGQS